MKFYTPSWRKLIAAVPQHVKIFNGTLLDNICLGNTKSQIRTIITFCKEHEISEQYFMKFPAGICYATWGGWNKYFRGTKTIGRVCTGFISATTIIIT